MKKILFVALTVLAATAARAGTGAQSLAGNTVLGRTSTSEVTSTSTVAPDVCLYANHIIPLGAVITSDDGSTQVCARGKHGPRFLDLAAAPRV